MLTVWQGTCWKWWQLLEVRRNRLNPTGQGEDHYYNLKPILKQTLIRYWPGWWTLWPGPYPASQKMATSHTLQRLKRLPHEAHQGPIRGKYTALHFSCLPTPLPSPTVDPPASNQGWAYTLMLTYFLPTHLLPACNQTHWCIGVKETCWGSGDINSLQHFTSVLTGPGSGRSWREDGGNSIEMSFLGGWQKEAWLLCTHHPEARHVVAYYLVLPLR